MGRAPPAMAENGKLDQIEERLKVIEGSGDYAFANLEELFLVPNVVTHPKIKPQFNPLRIHTHVLTNPQL